MTFFAAFISNVTNKIKRISDIVFDTDTSTLIVPNIQVTELYWSNAHVINFDVGVGGQSSFDSEVNTTNRHVFVFKNGVKQRLGATHDYQISSSVINFNYTVPQNAWIQIVIF